ARPPHADQPAPGFAALSAADGVVAVSGSRALGRRCGLTAPATRAGMAGRAAPAGAVEDGLRTEHSLPGRAGGADQYLHRCRSGRDQGAFAAASLAARPSLSRRRGATLSLPF